MFTGLEISCSWRGTAVLISHLDVADKCLCSHTRFRIVTRSPPLPSTVRCLTEGWVQESHTPSDFTEPSRKPSLGCGMGGWLGGDGEGVMSGNPTLRGCLGGTEQATRAFPDTETEGNSTLSRKKCFLGSGLWEESVTEVCS